MNTLLHSKTEVLAPLSGVHYDPSGVQVRCDATWVKVPSSDLLTDDYPYLELLDLLKANLDGEFELELRWHRFHHTIDRVEVHVPPPARKAIDDLKERIAEFRQSIVARAAAGALTLDDARDLLPALRCDEATLHRVLVKIVDSLPKQTRRIPVRVKLRELTYGDGEVQGRAEGLEFTAPESMLPEGVAVDPLLEHVKRHLVGDLVLFVDQVHLVKWDTDDGTLHFTVTTIYPVAAVADGVNAFRVEAQLDDPGPLARPGMAATARIEIGERSLLWLVSHRVLDWLRLQAWRVGL